jgi:hypothetical protein
VTSGARSGGDGDGSKKLYQHTKEMKKILERLLAKMDANQVKTDAN